MRLGPESRSDLNCEMHGDVCELPNSFGRRCAHQELFECFQERCVTGGVQSPENPSSLIPVLYSESISKLFVVRGRDGRGLVTLGVFPLCTKPRSRHLCPLPAFMGLRLPWSTVILLQDCRNQSAFVRKNRRVDDYKSYRSRERNSKKKHLEEATETTQNVSGCVCSVDLFCSQRQRLQVFLSTPQPSNPSKSFVRHALGKESSS